MMVYWKRSPRKMPVFQQRPAHIFYAIARQSSQDISTILVPLTRIGYSTYDTELHESTDWNGNHVTSDNNSEK